MGRIGNAFFYCFLYAEMVEVLRLTTQFRCQIEGITSDLYILLQ